MLIRVHGHVSKFAKLHYMDLMKIERVYHHVQMLQMQPLHNDI